MTDQLDMFGRAHARSSSMSEPREIAKSALISDDGLYRYQLARIWDDRRPLDLWLMLNPSDADAMINDPTIRRVIGFSTRDRAGGVVVGNLYAYRTPKPAKLWAAQSARIDIVGPDADRVLGALLEDTRRRDGRVICAWGAGAENTSRVWDVLALIHVHDIVPLCLGITKQGHPCHPLYLRADTPIEPFRWYAGRDDPSNH